MNSKKSRVVEYAELRWFTGLSRPAVLRMEREGLFPKRREMRQGQTVWDFVDVERWILTNAMKKI